MTNGYIFIITLTIPIIIIMIIMIFVECTLMVVESLTKKTPPSFSLWRILVASARDKEPWYHLDHLII